MARDVRSKNKTDVSLSIVLPSFNEAEGLTSQVLGLMADQDRFGIGLKEIIIVNDGSSDNTLEIAQSLSAEFPCVEVVSFHRNFGKEAAIQAGLKYSRGQIAIVMDSDGQHPPALIPKMIESWRSGNQVVIAKKEKRGRESMLSRFFAWTFYTLFRFFSKMDIRGLTDFMLLDQEPRETYLALPERKRFFRGMIMWLGFPVGTVGFTPPERFAGKSSWSFRNLLKLASFAIYRFTSTPLHLVGWVTGIYLVLAAILGGQTLYLKITGQAVTGFATVNIILLVTGAIILFGLWQIGIYIEQIFDEIKRRPNFIIDTKNSSEIIRDSYDS